MATITKVNSKTAANGNQYKQVFIDTKIQDKDMFNIFNDHTLYDSMSEGSTVDETLLYINNGYLNLSDPDRGVRRAPNAGKTRQIAEAQKSKAEYVQQAQENKEESIKISSTARDATLILTALINSGDMESSQWQENWKGIRKWLVENWDTPKTQVDEFSPF